MKVEIQKRTKAIGVEVIKLIDELPNRPSGWVIGKQIFRSATSLGSNYRFACSAKLALDFINELKIVEEADETIFWWEIIEENNLLPKIKIENIQKETNEILAAVVASIKTMRVKK